METRAVVAASTSSKATNNKQPLQIVRCELDSSQWRKFLVRKRNFFRALPCASLTFSSSSLSVSSTFSRRALPDKSEEVKQRVP